MILRCLEAYTVQSPFRSKLFIITHLKNNKNIYFMQSNFQFAHLKNLKLLKTDKPHLPILPLQQENTNSKDKNISATSNPHNSHNLLKQNHFLQEKVVELAIQMDEILEMEKQKKVYGIAQEDDETLKEKKMILNKQQICILQLKNNIFNLRKENEHTHDHFGLLQKEDQIKSMKIDIERLQHEKDGLLNIRKQKEKTLNASQDDQKYVQKIETIKQQITKIKQECRSLVAKNTEHQKLLSKFHEKQVSRNQTIKEISNKIKENKDKSKKGLAHIVTIEMITDIEAEISSLEKERNESEKGWEDKLKNLDLEITIRQVEQQKKLLILKEKEKEIRLNSIKLKEFQKLIRGEKLVAENSEGREFRSKRNIKIFESKRD